MSALGGYMLSCLVRAGVPVYDVVRAYCTIIRPGLTKELAKVIEQVQKHCPKRLYQSFFHNEAF